MINLNINVSKLIREARSSITDYCIDECGADCCKTRIVPCCSEKDVRVLLGLKDKSLEEFSFMYPKRLEKIGEIYLVHQPCANLEENKCKIYNNGLRPVHCIDFPIRASYDEDGFPFVEYTAECKAVEKGLFNRVLDILRDNYVFVLQTR